MYRSLVTKAMLTLYHWDSVCAATKIKPDDRASGARFSKVPIINGPGKLSPFTLKIEVSIVLHLA